MKIEVAGLGKKFQRDWIFRNLDYTFDSAHSYAVTGHNGSGKSTFLQVLIGFIPPNEGQVTFKNGDHVIEVDQTINEFDIITPYLELVEEFTLDEFLKFHFKFKTLKVGFTIDDFVEKVYLAHDRNKEIKYFSSGMKQRLKLGLGFYSDSGILLLDEPTTNLDERGTQWYLDHVKEVLSEKMVIISSNQKHEFDFCTKQIHIPDFK